MARPSYLPDNFTLSLVAVVALASLLPASGAVAHFFEALTTVAIGVLFFLHGAKLSREALVGGVLHWRLHLLVFAGTFVLFPVLGLVLRPVLEPLVTPALYAGVLFLCVLPATVQSAIALVSMARGNVPAAICSASASTLMGVFVTPVLVGLVVMPGSQRGVVARCDRPHPAATDAAVRDRAPAAALDRRMGAAPWCKTEVCRPGLHPAGGLHRVQRRRHQGPVAAGAVGDAGRAAGGLRRPARPRP